MSKAQGGWAQIGREAASAFLGAGRFPLRAYSEYMPPPWVAVKPAEHGRLIAPADGDATYQITEYEEAQELAPGLAKIAKHILGELDKLARGSSHELSHTMLDGNPAWPAELAAKAKALKHPLVIALPLALSRSQDDKGRGRWTLFGASHEGPGAGFWASFPDDASGVGELHRFVAWAAGSDADELGNAHKAGIRVLAAHGEKLPAFARSLLLREDEAVDRVHTLVTFRAFADLPDAVRAAYLAGKLQIVPCPQSLVFWGHQHYAKLATQLPHAVQIPLLHLFPRSEDSYGIRIPQSGWLDEHDPATAPARANGHKMVRTVARTHRWERVPRDHAIGEGDGRFEDKISVALFSTNPDDLGLYGKPMARNVQIWRESYQLLLDGPRAQPKALEAASQAVDQGGRFGYRFLFPAMRAGARTLYWHRPLCARLDPKTGEVTLLAGAPLGHITAELDGQPAIALTPALLDREPHRAAATLFELDPGHKRHTTSDNVRKLLEFRDLLGAPLAPSFARHLVHIAKDLGLDDWIASLPGHAADHKAGERLAKALHGVLAKGAHPGAEAVPVTLGETGKHRAFEEQIWKTIAFLAEGEFREKDNADVVNVNKGKKGGPAAKKAHREAAERRDLEKLGDHLHARYDEMIARHGMQGKARCVDHRFKWETDFDFGWSNGWLENQSGKARERNVVMMIPGKKRGEAIVMGDHYDTAYMEDVYDEDVGGDGLRAAAAGADDNHSATTALLLCAETLLPLAKAGKLERDVWLVHLTGEEFPSDCLGARALAQGFVEKSLQFVGEDGKPVDVSGVTCKGVYVLDMVAHNNDRDRDIFQIAPGEGAGSARLALEAHLANERWNRLVEEWNQDASRKGKGRAVRMKDGAQPPPAFAHLAVSGEVRTEWEPRSALYNTDGQIFSDMGIPVVLFMENYDISRKGYHDTHDTMENIDLDFAAAVTSIAIESVAVLATAKDL